MIFDKIFDQSEKLSLFTLKMMLRTHSLTYQLISYLSHKVEKDGLHPKHRIMNYHKFFVDNITSNDTILDIGCGNGALTYHIAEKAKRVVGIDLNGKSIKKAMRCFSRENLEYIYGDALTNLPGGQFDVIILSNLLEHIAERVKFLDCLKERASKFLIRVPMSNRSWLDIYKKELGLEYRLDKTHFIEYTFESFSEEMAEAGLTVLSHSIQFGEIWAVVELKEVKE